MCSHKRNNLKKTLVSISSDNSGAVAVIVGICLFALMIATALAIDVGSLFEDRRHLQTVADAAALAGAQELPENPEEAEKKARDYVSYNYNKDVDINIEIEPFLGAADASITVTVVNPDSPLYFARVMNMESTPVGATATAIIASPEAVNNIVPWGIPYEDFKIEDEVVLKLGSGPSGHSISGNFQCLAPDRKPNGKPITGSDEYEKNIINGSDDLLRIGEMIWTEPGGNVGKTRSGTQSRIDDQYNGKLDLFDTLTQDYLGGNELAIPDSQFIIVPIIDEVDYSDIHGRKEVEILDFACIIITDIQDMHGDLEYGNGIAIVGQFLTRALVNSDGSVVAAGTNSLRVVRLIK